MTGATCWLVNTGWTGGPFGIGKRIGIKHTHARSWTPPSLAN